MSASSGFSIDSSAPDTLAVSGALLFANAAQALSQLRAALPRGQMGNLNLNLAGLDSADSAGLACVLALMSDVRSRGGTLRVQAVPDGMLALAQVCAVDKLLLASAA